MRALIAVVLLALAGCKCAAPPVAQVPAVPKCVPAVLVAHRGTPTLDGELDEPVWHAAAATGPFLNDQVNRVVPHTEARAAWDSENLYLVLYVADGDLRTGDQVTVEFEGGGTLEVTPARSVRCHLGAQLDCAAAGVEGKFEVDGDVDADQEEDEEWAVELKVPWKVLAPAGRPPRLPVNFSRLETLEGERLKEVWSRGCGALSLE